ncbi:hypothetical protein PAHAL_5G199800 [Panicum hallii]|uniref:Wall-associated receptor kinase galacturonan-binding domain-containing protein n=1 Tax=Panicum hallii TaxID=206008 RepID=A0A2S3HSW4_9POAL|nr:hypothetical protein PAHAL_5G199800 [Panicum hallii]
MSPPRLLAAMAAHLPRFPVLLFFFLAFHVAAAHGDPAPLPTTYDGSMCPESSSCGNVSIRYPFYLSSTTRNSTDYSYNYNPYSCGYTDLEIFCQDEGPTGTPVISLGGDNYTILNIDYGSKTIILADSDVLVGGSCPAVRHGVSFNKMWLHNTSSNANLTFYFNCYSTRRDGEVLPPDLVTYEIGCNFKSPYADGASFVFTPDDNDKAKEHALDQDGRCKEVVSVPVRSEVLMARNQSVLVTGGYAEVLWYGFELEWNRATTDECYLCEQSDGKCAYSQKREFMGCLCSNGKVGHLACRPSKFPKTDHSI